MAEEFDLLVDVPAFPAYALPPDAFPRFSSGSYGGTVGSHHPRPSRLRAARSVRRRGLCLRGATKREQNQSPVTARFCAHLRRVALRPQDWS
jgi:hypothetical protein